MTNTLRVHFPDALASGTTVSIATAFEELGRFGDVARVEVPTNGSPAAVVSFYDVRAALQAFEALPGRCTVEPWYGEHALVLDGVTELKGWVIPELASIQEDSDGKYILEFFDTRMAERAAREFDGNSLDFVSLVQRKFVSLEMRCALTSEPDQLAVGMEFLRHATPMGGQSFPDAVRRSPVMAEPPGLEKAPAGPRYRNDLRLSEVMWPEIRNGRESRTTLHFRCLPARLCDREAFKSVLVSAGLDGFVDCFRVFPGRSKRSGAALVNATDTKGVAALTKYFHGRQWGQSLPVNVSFAGVQGPAEMRSVSHPGLALAGSDRTGQCGKPVRIEACDLKACNIAKDSTGVSEISTELSDEEAARPPTSFA